MSTSEDKSLEGTGIRIVNIAKIYEHTGYDPDEITQLYRDLSLSDVQSLSPTTTTISTNSERIPQ
jgi:uncharacterized protein (DUF433 family)